MASGSQQFFDDAGADIDAQRFRKTEIGCQGKHEPGNRIADRLPAAEAVRNEHEKDRRRRRKPSGPIRATLAIKPAATKPTDFQSAFTSRSSSGCQPPRIAWIKRRTASTTSPAAVMYGKTVGPTFEVHGRDRHCGSLPRAAAAQINSPMPISASGSAKPCCGSNSGR